MQAMFHDAFSLNKLEKNLPFFSGTPYEIAILSKLLTMQQRETHLQFLNGLTDNRLEQIYLRIVPTLNEEKKQKFYLVASGISSDKKNIEKIINKQAIQPTDEPKTIEMMRDFVVRYNEMRSNLERIENSLQRLLNKVAPLPSLHLRTNTWVELYKKRIEFPKIKHILGQSQKLYKRFEGFLLKLGTQS